MQVFEYCYDCLHLYKSLLFVSGSLLSKAQFSLTTVDVETIVVYYSDMFQLMDDLRGMGESNASVLRGPPLKRSTMFAAAAAYQSMYGNGETIPATYQIIFLTGWHPSDQQQKPLPRGSSKFSLKDLNQLDTKDPSGIASDSSCGSDEGNSPLSLSNLGETFPIFLDKDDPDVKKK